MLKLKRIKEETLKWENFNGLK